MGATKAVWIEWRGPKTKEEKSVYGQTTFTNESTARIFINSRKNKTTEDQVKTFWHEMTHAFLHFHRHKKTAKQEERICQKLERVIWEILN